MRKYTSLLLGLCIMALTFPVLGAEEDPNLLLIKARKGEMNMRAMYATPLFMMAKGKIPYDAEQAQKLANSLKALMDIDMGMAWAADTGKDKYPKDTHSLPEIWSTYPAVADKGKEYAAAVNAFAEVAGGGLEQLRSKIGDLGDGCKGCHDDFREKE